MKFWGDFSYEELIAIQILILSFGACSVKQKSNSINTRVHDIWIVKRINGHPINKGERPSQLEINLTTMQVFGNNGCNEYRGRIKKLRNTRISIKHQRIVDKNCKSEFDKALEETVSYQLKGLHLIFFNKNGNECLMFLKGD